MKDKKLLFICIFSFVMVVVMGYFSYDITNRMLSTSFGGITGNLVIKYNVIYSSNYPESVMEDSTKIYNEKIDYIILDNMFDEIAGYEFVGWNTKADGSGIMYLANDSITLTNNITLYAQWEKVFIEVIFYGDVNKNGLIDEDDYKLLDNYILGDVILDEDALVNADVNIDGNIDLVDVDIIKQAVMGTDGYVDILPNNPILKYEIYVDDNDSEEDNTDNEENIDKEEDKESDTGSSGVVVPGGNTGGGSGNGTGAGSTGSGNASTGSGNNNVTENISGGNTSGNGNNVVNDNDIDNGSDKDVDVDVITSYEFKYMIGDLIYSITECKEIVNGSCDLVLPKGIPVRDGYNFLGWSLDKSCSNNTFINSSMSVSENLVYYACFLESKKSGNKSYIGIMVFVIWVMAGILIYRVVSKYNDRKKISE